MQIAQFNLFYRFTDLLNIYVYRCSLKTPYFSHSLDNE